MAKKYGVTSGLLLAAAVSSASQAIEFTEVDSSVSGLNYVGETWGASWGDFNGDRYPDMYVSNHRARPSIWRNNGDGTFTDIVIQFDTSYTWLDNPIIDTHGGAWGDFDNDGVQDLIVTTGSRFPSQFFVNDGTGVAVDETVARSVPDDREGRTPMWWDYDNDGVLDMLLANGGFNITAKQTGGMFTDVNSDVGFDSFRANFGVLSDVDMDDHLELFTVPDGDFPRKVYKTDSDIWTDITATQPFSGLVIDAAFADFNNDLAPDILAVRGSLRPNQALKVTDGDIGETDKIEWYVDGGASSGERGLLFQAEGPITVTVHSTIGYPRYFIGSEGYNPLYTTTFTLDPTLETDQGILEHDEDTDQGFYFGYDTNTETWAIYMSPGSNSTRGYLEIEGVDMTDPVETVERTGDTPIVPKLFMNDGGTGYTDVAGIGLSFPISCVSVVTGDFDNDMDQDIYLVCRDGIQNLENILYVNNGDGTFTRTYTFGAEGVIGTGLDSGVGVGENVVTADYDLDGWLDLFVLNGLLMNPIRVGGPDQLFRNTGFETSDNRWLLLDLVGTVSNRDALGAKVIVTSGGVSQLRERTGNHHRWSQNHTRLHVGLGQNDVADIEVRWPNGEVDIFTDVSANGLYEITQGIGGSQTGSLATFTPTSAPAFPLPELGDECGIHPDDQPDVFPFSFDPAQDLGLFVWKDCAVTEKWFMRFSAGGGEYVVLEGTLTANGTISDVEGFLLEPSDYVDTDVPGLVDFKMGVGVSGVDGFDFTIDGNVNTCLNVDVLPAGTKVMIGKAHIPVTGSIDLTTMKPCVEVWADDVTVNEGDGTALIPVNLSSVTDAVVTVDYTLIADTALADSDFVAGAGSVTFEVGETSANIEVALLDDALFEEPEQFSVELSSPSGAFVSDALAIVTLEDNEVCVECGQPTYDPGTEQALFIWRDLGTNTWHVSGAGGGDSNGVFFDGFVSSTQAFIDVMGVSIEPSDVLDYTTNPDTIDYLLKVWNSGEDGFVFTTEEGAQTCFNITGPIDVPVFVGETQIEVNGSFNLETLGSCLELSVADVSVSEGDEFAVFTVTLSETAADVVAVDYTTQADTATAGVDFTEVVSPQTLTFEVGETSKTVSIPVIQDAENESDETFVLNLSNPVNATIGNLSATATIIDDEVNACGAPSFEPVELAAIYVWEDCATGEWSVYATGGGSMTGVFYEGEVVSEDGFDTFSQFRMEASDSADNVTDPTTIDYLLKVWNRDLDAFLFTPTTKETTCLSLDGPAGVPILAGANKVPMSSPFNLATLGACEITVIVDMSIDDIEVSEAETEAVFTVSLSEPSSDTVTVQYVTLGDTATGDLDYVEVTTPTTVTFEPGVTEQQIVVTLLPDNLSEDVTETFTVELSSATNATIIDTSGTADIFDDEVNSCGYPSYNKSTEQNLYIWRDCGSNNWTVHTTAGGSASRVDYIGQLSSTADITNVGLVSIEANDIVDNSADPKVLNFTNYMRNSGYDGFTFTVEEGSSTCLTLDPASTVGTTVLVGAAKTPLVTPIDLSTLEACQ